LAKLVKSINTFEEKVKKELKGEHSTTGGGSSETGIGSKGEWNFHFSKLLIPPKN
jgi:hypothetical protein